MSTNVNGSNTENRKRINLNVIGKSGATTVVASFRTDDKVAGGGPTDCVSLPFPSTWKFFCINMTSLQ
jgi:hypothetical protein